MCGIGLGAGLLRRLSKGFLIDKLMFDKATGLLRSSLVARQMTLEVGRGSCVGPPAWARWGHNPAFDVHGRQGLVP